VKVHFVKDVAEILGVSPKTVGTWISAGELKVFVVSESESSRRPRYRVTEASLTEFMAKRALVPAVAPARQRRKSRDDSDVIHFYR
jgi:predicted site-specific integrase-resolvase